MLRGGAGMMRAVTRCWAIVGCLVGIPPQFVVAQQPEATAARYTSPRIRRLAEELRKGNQEALEEFWKELQGHVPLVEPIPGNDQLRWISFIWRGDKETRNVVILGDVPTTDVSKWKLQRLEGTDVWFKTDRVPKDARFGYAFGVNGAPFQPDPLNPRVFAHRSVAELPDAPPQRWIAERPDVPKGVLAEHTVPSKILKEDRSVAVYTPPGYDPKATACGLLIVFDGEAYGSAADALVPTPTILDNLLSEKKIPPLVAVLVDSQKTRGRDLQCSAPFADVLAQELVPWVGANYRVSEKPAQVILAGSSDGGLCAAYAAWKHPRVFGNVLSQSGNFAYVPNPGPSANVYTRESGWLTRQFVTTPCLHLRFYLEVGTLEAGSVVNPVAEHRRLRDVLEAKGYSVTYSEFSGGMIISPGVTRSGTA